MQRQFRLAQRGLEPRQELFAIRHGPILSSRPRSALQRAVYQTQQGHATSRPASCHAAVREGYPDRQGTGAFVALDITASTLSGELPDLAHPRVEVFAPQHDPAQRSTLTETATRLDSVVNTAMAREAGLLD